MRRNKSFFVCFCFHNTENSVSFKTYEFFMSVNFYLIFEDCNWPQVTETVLRGELLMGEPDSICLVKAFMKFILSQVESYLLIATECFASL